MKLERVGDVVVEAPVGIAAIAEAGDIVGEKGVAYCVLCTLCCLVGYFVLFGYVVVFSSACEENFEADIPSHLKAFIDLHLASCYHFSPAIGVEEVVIVGSCISPIGCIERNMSEVVSLEGSTEAQSNQ